MGRRVISTTPRPLYPLLKTRYPLYSRLGGQRGRSGLVRKISLPTHTGILSPDRPALSAVAIPELCGTGWINVDQYRESLCALMIAVMYFIVPQMQKDFLTSCWPVIFSRRTPLRIVSHIKVSSLQAYVAWRVPGGWGSQDFFGKVFTPTHRMPLPSPGISWYSFVETESTFRICFEKIPSDTTGNRSRDLPTSTLAPYRIRIPLKMKTNWMGYQANSQA
jgi:hypothetical protein